MAITVVTDAIQGPAGPPAGIGTATFPLAFIGSGSGSTKTTTQIEGNMIYEEFGVGDEVFTYFKFPPDMDKTKDMVFYGTWFPTNSDGTGYLTDWEIHITVHNHQTNAAISDTISVTDLPVPGTAFEFLSGQVSIDHVTFDFANMHDVHIRLKRVLSSNEPPNGIGISLLTVEYTTDGKVGLQGETGPQGPAGGEEVALAKQVDFITDNEFYIGEANPGTLTSASSWRIKYVTIAGDGDVSVVWADGNDSFDNIWDNRLTYSYS